MAHLLYGSNGEDNIVAVHPASDQTMRVYSRTRGKLASDEVNFYPFFFLTDPSYLKKFEKRCWIKELQGDNPLRYIAAFTSWSDMWEGVRSCLLSYNETSEAKVQTYQELPVIYIRPDPIVQFLKQSGRTLFKNMKFIDLRRMQIDIVTLMKRGSVASNPERPGDQIVVIALSDNSRWQQVIHAKRKDESAILTEFVKLIRQRDPDIIEGLFTTSFIIPYIITRCRLLGIEAAIGRDGSVPAPPDPRTLFSERSITASSALIAGRHVIDVQLLHESTAGSKPQHSKSVFRQLIHLSGETISPPVTGAQQFIPFTWENEPDKIIGQSEETTAVIIQITNRFLPQFAALARMLPFNLAPVTRLNSSSMIDSLVYRSFINLKLSMPRSVSREHTQVDFAEIFSAGIFSPVIVLDVKAIVASVIIDENIQIQNDASGIYTQLLSEILHNYLMTQKDFINCTDPVIRDELFSLHKANTTLVDASADHFLNSRSRFYDPAAVDTLFHKTHNILNDIITHIHSARGAVIQSDMDGLFFLPPEGILNDSEEDKFVDGLARKLSGNVILRKSGRYKSMLSYKKKNYALLNHDGRISINGPSLVPRTTEGFGKKFLSRCIEALMKKDITQLHDVYMAFHKDILGHRFNVSDYQRTETLTFTKEEYLREVTAGTRHRTTSFEVAIRSELAWSAGDKISYYVSGDDPNPRNFESYKIADDWDPEFPDENTAYYLKRLAEFAKKFDLFFSPQDFHPIFSAEDLFGFSAEGKVIINSQTAAGGTARPDEDSDSFEINPKIWLDI